jgi:hypothetical protein
MRNKIFGILRLFQNFSFWNSSPEFDRKTGLLAGFPRACSKTNRVLEQALLLMILLIMGCVGTAPGTGSAHLFAEPPEPAGSSGGMDLDAAIREAAAQMGRNLPRGT